MAKSVREMLLGKPTGHTVVIAEVRPHGGDLLYARGTVDGVEVSAYLDRAVCEVQGRRYVAGKLASCAPPPNPYAAYLGREERVP